MFPIAFGVAIVGIILLGVSNLMYFNRTKNKPFQRFWLGKELLTTNEYILNRGGFALSIVGIVLIYWMRFAG